MDQRTVNIIFCCKHHGEGEDYFERIAKYMSKECDCPESTYAPYEVYSLLREAAFNFVSTSQEGAAEFAKLMIKYSSTPFLSNSEVNNVTKQNLGAIRVVCDIYSNVFNELRVRHVDVENDTVAYINGFTEESVEEAKEVLGSAK